jgi:hypothetical protein
MSPAEKLAELQERRYFLMGQMDLAMQPRRIIRFQTRCTIIGAVVVALPLLIHQAFHGRVASPFGNPPNMVAVWVPGLALAILAVSSWFANTQKQRPGDSNRKFRSSIKTAAFFVAAAAVVMATTGISDLQREFTVPEHVAAMIESAHKGDKTSPTVLHWVICGFAALFVATFFQSLYVRIVVKPSWLYRQSLLEPPNCDIESMPKNQAGTSGNPHRDAQLTYSLVEARYRTRFLCGGLYVMIAASAYLYFLFGRQRYMRDPIAFSFGLTAYLLNIVLVLGAFRSRRAYLVELRSNHMTPERASDFARIWRWSVGNAAAAIVYSLLLSRGGLDAFTDALQKAVIPNWTHFQTWVLSSLIAVSILNILCSLIAGWIGQRLSRSHYRRKRVAARAARQA